MSTNPPPDVRKEARDAARAGSPGEQVLAHAQAGREVVQQFVVLSESLN